MFLFEQIIDVPNNTKDQLYVEVNSWFVETFNSAESVIEFQDKEAGRVMGKYSFFMDGDSNFIIRSTITVDVKDNKVRIQCTKPMLKYFIDHWTDWFPVDTELGANKVQTQWNSLASNLKSRLSKIESEW